MNKRQIDQGTIIYGVRSNKYPSTPCYGVIITARCDIAQGKVPKYYYLVAVDASTWLYSSHGFEQAYQNHISSKLLDIIKKAQEVDLDGLTLSRLSSEDAGKVISDSLAQHSQGKAAEKKHIALQKALQEYHLFCGNKMNDQDRKRAIAAKEKPAIECMKNIDGGKMHHYYYLPQLAYLENGRMDSGLIVDLLEISSLPIEDARRLTDPFAKSIIYDNMPKIPDIEQIEQMLKDKNERVLKVVMNQIAEHIRLSEAYWLRDESCFVDIEGVIRSPWREHLMQRFSNAFVRIGIDNPTESDYETVVHHVNEEVHENEILAV